jgi:hypothetical protein
MIFLVYHYYLAFAHCSENKFYWATLQLDAFKKCLRPTTIIKAMKLIPKPLEDTYSNIWHSIDDEYRHQAILALQWLVFFTQPLSIQEPAEAITINPQLDSNFDPGERFADSSDVLQIQKYRPLS